jgi:hypothetical protein
VATAEKTFGRAAALAVGALVVIALVVWSIRRRRRELAARPGNRG